MLIFIRELTQLNNFAFRINWSDGKYSAFRLGELQKKCPCARCRGSHSPKDVDLDVRAVKIFSVGNYALRIDFTGGCSRGVFTFNFLRELNLQES